MPRGPNPLLTGSSWNDLAGQTALDVKNELEQRRKMMKQRMTADPMTGQSMVSQNALPAGGSYQSPMGMMGIGR